MVQSSRAILSVFVDILMMMMMMMGGGGGDTKEIKRGGGAMRPIASINNGVVGGQTETTMLM